MSESTRTILLVLYAAIVAALSLSLPEATRRSLRGALCQLARDLDMPAPLMQ